jgi:tRNA threonylcarbamoyladenosine biosynthesis protein TsaB
VIVLAIDTCDLRGSVALLKDENLFSFTAHDTGEEYSSWLLPAVEGVLQNAEIRMADVDGYAVAAGPGSFTGVRVGLTTVKAWAEVYGKPVAGVSRLEAIAMHAAEGGRYVAASADARRQQVFGAVYRREGEKLELVGDEMVIAPGKFIENVASVAGDARVSWATTDGACLIGAEEWCAREKFNEALETVSPYLAGAIGRIGSQQLKEGRSMDALTLDANYVRRSDAEIFWKGGTTAAGKK